MQRVSIFDGKGFRNLNQADGLGDDRTYRAGGRGALPRRSLDLSAFFELCTRYISRHFSFCIEVNHPSGRSDWEMLGRPESEYKNQKWIVGFKHYPKSSGMVVEEITTPDPQDVAQAEGYKRDTLAQFPHYEVRTAVCITVGNTGFRWFDLSTN